MKQGVGSAKNRHMVPSPLPLPPNTPEPRGGCRGDAFKDRCVECSLLRVCECVIEKQQSSYSSFSSDSPSLARGPCVLDLHGPLVWISCPAGAVARRLVYGRGEQGGRLVAPPPIPLSSSLSSSSSSSASSSSSSSSWFSSCSFLAPTPSVPRPQMCLFMCRARWSDLEKHLQRQTETLCWKDPKKSPPPPPCTRWGWKIQKPEIRSC